MKKYLLLISVIFILASCENQTAQKKTAVNNPVEGKIFGNKIENSDIITAQTLSYQLAKDEEKEMKLIGKVDAVCQMTGCWIDLDMGNNQTVHVTFKDEAFTLPKDITGKTAVINGLASKEEISVDELKKAAKAEGKTQEEIDAITQAKVEYYFEADGVTLK